MAARNAAETPGVYNPLYIFGGSGVGKTHLLHAVANAARKQNPGMVVRYATCDELLNDFYDLLQQKKSLSETVLRNLAKWHRQNWWLQLKFMG